ncbi:EMBP1 protein, partial [Rhinopomastus cyanomelas]|nr:EMBP1 protein [Rhinopomastus cyanomelas]
MPPCLLLALALLGTACAGHPTPCHPQNIPMAPGREGRRFQYAVVTRRLSYQAAQWNCQKELQGQLASVHSAARNQELQELAQTYTSRSLWIGAVTRPKGNQSGSHWEDASPWNYANWAPTQPCRLFTTCTTLSARDGLWRSRPCFQLRPFICQY